MPTMLVERSRIDMQLASAIADAYVKQQLRIHALALARRAEIEREENEEQEAEKLAPGALSRAPGEPKRTLGVVRPTAPSLPCGEAGL
jgi:hypothetical protein